MALYLLHRRECLYLRALFGSPFLDKAVILSKRLPSSHGGIEGKEGDCEFIWPYFIQARCVAVSPSLFPNWVERRTSPSELGQEEARDENPLKIVK